MKWKVPNMWEGGECWILGGGSSVPREFGIPEDVIQAVMNKVSPVSIYSPYLSPIHGKHVIGINAAYKIGTWMDIIFFGDGGFYLENRDRLLEYPKLKVSCNPKIAGQFKGDGVKYTPKNTKQSHGISRERDKISWNDNSGAAAISIAANAGAKRIILLGFDMALGEDGSQHWHKEYKRPTGPKKPHSIKRKPFNLPFAKHLIGFEMIANNAKDRGIEIINASPNSTITQFKKVSVKDLL